MKTILFTDTHYGWKQNSNPWLESQLKFIDKQLIPFIQKESKKGPIKLIHLGDVFDSRSSISTLVATKVKEAFNRLADNVEYFIVLAGNHDFYSPNSDEIDTISLVLGDISNIQVITKGCVVDESNLYVPWYEWMDQKNIQKLVNENNIKTIFTHADIVSTSTNIVGPIIYSGHIHTPSINNRLRNLGSCYSLNFSDANSERGFYEINENGNLKFYANTESIKFWRLYNEDIFKDSKISKINKNDYIELYINQSNMIVPEYIDRINQLTKDFKNIWVIPQTKILESTELDSFEGYDIEAITRELVPDELKSKFKQIINSLKNE